MGFYIDLLPSNDLNEFKETSFPPSFWVLYLIAGFALLCMGLSAGIILKDLFITGTAFDKTIIFLIASSLPFYLLFGLKLAFVRKFISIKEKIIQFGFTFNRKILFQKTIQKSDVESVFLINRKPSTNRAPIHHGDNQYYIRGHWRVGLKLKNGKNKVLDKHTEEEALKPLFLKAENWLHQNL